jgi:hypothetical protein
MFDQPLFIVPQRRWSVKLKSQYDRPIKFHSDLVTSRRYLTITFLANIFSLLWSEPVLGTGNRWQLEHSIVLYMNTLRHLVPKTWGVIWFIDITVFISVILRIILTAHVVAFFPGLDCP